MIVCVPLRAAMFTSLISTRSPVANPWAEEVVTVTVPLTRRIRRFVVVTLVLAEVVSERP